MSGRRELDTPECRAGKAGKPAPACAAGGRRTLPEVWGDRPVDPAPSPPYNRSPPRPCEAGVPHPPHHSPPHMKKTIQQLEQRIGSSLPELAEGGGGTGGQFGGSEDHRDAEKRYICRGSRILNKRGETYECHQQEAGREVERERGREAGRQWWRQRSKVKAGGEGRGTPGEFEVENAVGEPRDEGGHVSGALQPLPPLPPQSLHTPVPPPPPSTYGKQASHTPLHQLPRERLQPLSRWPTDTVCLSNQKIRRNDAANRTDTDTRFPVN